MIDIVLRAAYLMWVGCVVPTRFVDTMEESIRCGLQLNAQFVKALLKGGVLVEK